MVLGHRVDDPHMVYVVCQTRAQGRCEYCGEESTIKPFVYKDQKRHPGAGGMIALCRECHGRIQKQEELPKTRRKKNKPDSLFEPQWEKQIDRNKL